MNFDDLDKSMRIYETVNDHCVLPGINLVVRLDGRHFTKLTRNPDYKFEAPFDRRFDSYMDLVTEHLMRGSGFRFIYGYHQSDEISLLLHAEDNTFNRKTRKINSILASEAGAVFTHFFGHIATFDSRVIQLPTLDLVARYFNWRQLDATRNALNSWCYWSLRKKGMNARKATAELEGATVAQKNELLFQFGINFNDLPLWQKRGTGYYFEMVPHEGYNPIKKIATSTMRNRIQIDPDLDSGDKYYKTIYYLAKTNGTYIKDEPFESVLLTE